jgi:hypothetical protein
VGLSKKIFYSNENMNINKYRRSGCDVAARCRMNGTLIALSLYDKSAGLDELVMDRQGWTPISPDTINRPLFIVEGS